MFDVEIKIITENLKDVKDYGMKSFETIPRVGEYVKMEQGSTILYEVASVIYHNDYTSFYQPTLLLKKLFIRKSL